MTGWTGYLLLAYFLASSAVAVKYVRGLCDPEDGPLAGLSATNRFARVGLVLAAVFLGLGLLLPFVEAYRYLKGRREAGFWSRFSRTFRDHVFERLNVSKMPAQAQQYIALHTPEMGTLGFSIEGDYLLKPHPVPLFGRCFLSSDGETVGVLSFILDTAAFSLTTVLDNGRVIETASVEVTGWLERVNESESGRYTCLSAHGEGLLEAYQRHQEAVAQIAVQHGCHRLSFTPDQVTDVMQYENRVFGEAKFALGELDEPPPRAECPPGSIRVNAGCKMYAVEA